MYPEELQVERAVWIATQIQRWVETNHCQIKEVHSILERIFATIRPETNASLAHGVAADWAIQQNSDTLEESIKKLDRNTWALDSLINYANNILNYLR